MKKIFSKKYLFRNCLLITAILSVAVHFIGERNIGNWIFGFSQLSFGLILVTAFGTAIALGLKDDKIKWLYPILSAMFIYLLPPLLSIDQIGFGYFMYYLVFGALLFFAASLITALLGVIIGSAIAWVRRKRKKFQIIKTITQIREHITAAKRDGKSIGFVPTMGALHEGHLSLIRKSAAENDITVVSIFVNPTQFAANEDLDKYPRTLERDCELSKNTGATVIFAPTIEEMYGRRTESSAPTHCTYVDVESLTQGLCGKSRSTHFRGVTTVVAKLFNIVSPDRAYFGQKDAQQLAVITKMAADLNMPVKIIPCETVREPDGLAMSSRNAYLSPAEREQAIVLYQSLTAAKELISAGERNAATVKGKIISILNSKNLAIIDYVEIVDFETFCEAETIVPPTLIALAVKFGNTRLIDNVIIL